MISPDVSLANRVTALCMLSEFISRLVTCPYQHCIQEISTVPTQKDMKNDKTLKGLFLAPFCILRGLEASDYLQKPDVTGLFFAYSKLS
jgi:hypothetical protein